VGRFDRLLVSAGAGAALLYVALGLTASFRHPSYSMRDHAISELSAGGAPSAKLWAWVSPFFGLLLVLFGVGMLRSTRVRGFRAAAGLILALAALGPLWVLFPMHQRGAGTAAGVLVTLRDGLRPVFALRSLAPSVRKRPTTSSRSRLPPNAVRRYGNGLEE
jgi:hypothetical protein